MVDAVVKTKEVSDIIGVGSKTVRKWVKQYNIPFSKNEQGHYVYNEEALDLIKQIKKEADSKSASFVSNSEIFSKLDRITERLDSIEYQLSCKANEIVHTQVLQHRHEIDDVINKLESINNHIKRLEEGMKESQESQEIQPESKQSKNWILHFLT